MALCLTVKLEGSVKIGEVTMTLIQIKGKQVRVKFEGSESTKINRLGADGKPTEFKVRPFCKCESGTVIKTKDGRLCANCRGKINYEVTNGTKK